VPTLVLPPRYTSDSNAIRAATLPAGWAVERLASWRVPAGLRDRDPVLYGAPLFVDVVAFVIRHMSVAAHRAITPATSGSCPV
jgi:hypothetical protein